MDQRLTIITLGVSSVKASEKFYSETLGWKKTTDSNEHIVFYNLGGFLLALYHLDALAEDAQVASAPLTYRGFTLAYNTHSEAEVDTLLEELAQKGVNIIKKPQKAFWGGYSGYFADPDENLWEVAYNPFLALDEKGRIV